MRGDQRSFVQGYCAQTYGELPEDWRPLRADGSARHFFRVRCAEHTLVVLSHPEGVSTGENDAYVTIGRHLGRRGIPVPAIHAYQRESGWVIMEDLGDRSLHEAVSTAVDPDDMLALYGPVLDVLVRFQRDGARGFRETWCYQGARYDVRLMVDAESGYFLRSFLEGYLGWSGPRSHLVEEFHRLASMTSSVPGFSLIHRDFQSRNILLPALDTPHLIDFQGARWGPLQYDVAALIIDPYVPLTRELRETILMAYLERLEASGLMHAEAFMHHYPIIALHRNLQILGAFAFLGGVKGKSFFLQWIPAALAHLRTLLGAHPEWGCPHLREGVEQAWTQVAQKGPGGPQRP